MKKEDILKTLKEAKIKRIKDSNENYELGWNDAIAQIEEMIGE